MASISSIDWGSVLTGGITILLVIALKFLLDLKVAHFFVKYLSFLPLRNFFREKPQSLKGEWEMIWAPGGSVGFFEDTDRHGHSEVKQLGSYVYAEFYSQQIKYAFFGQIQSGYVIGDWFDPKDRNGYFGVFQLEIVNKDLLKGVWLGHSKTSREIRSDILTYTKVGS